MSELLPKKVDRKSGLTSLPISGTYEYENKFKIIEMLEV
jgi:hypothetical protein